MSYFNFGDKIHYSDGAVITYVGPFGDGSNTHIVYDESDGNAYRTSIIRRYKLYVPGFEVGKTYSNNLGKPYKIVYRQDFDNPQYDTIFIGVSESSGTTIRVYASQFEYFTEVTDGSAE